MWLINLGEYQPVYDEFGAVLVLVMAFVHRYNLTYHDIGIGHDSFMARLLEKGHRSMFPADMTKEQDKHLGNWLKGLFDSDREGLSNDVFASCRPQDFYLIVPTLFLQTVLACSEGILSWETVKSGLECEKRSSETVQLLTYRRSWRDIPPTIFDRWPQLDGNLRSCANTQRP